MPAPKPFKLAKSVKGRRRRDGPPGSPYQGAWYYANIRPNHSGVLVDETTALNLTAIWRGVKVKADDLAKLPLNLYERIEGKGKRPIRSNSIYELLCFPNETQTGRRLRHVQAVHLTLWGNSYTEIIRDEETGDPLRLELLDPRWVKPRRDHAGRLTYWLRGRQSPWTGKKSLLPENILHFAGMSLNGDEAISPIMANAEALGTATALDQYAGTLWGNGAQPNGVIECPPGWPDDARINFRQSFQEEHGGVGRANRVAILEEGAKWVATSANPEQLQMLSSRQYSVVEIARIVGLPPHKLFDFSHDVERSLEESNRDYYETSLEPEAINIADEITLKLLTVAGRKLNFVAFDMNALMRGNALARAQTNEIKMRNGVITANEWRAEDGLNPFDDDLRIMPLNMARVEDGTATLPPAPAEGEPEEQPTDPEPLRTGGTAA